MLKVLLGFLYIRDHLFIFKEGLLHLILKIKEYLNKIKYNKDKLLIYFQKVLLSSKIIEETNYNIIQ